MLLKRKFLALLGALHTTHNNVYFFPSAAAAARSSHYILIWLQLQTKNILRTRSSYELLLFMHKMMPYSERNNKIIIIYLLVVCVCWSAAAAAACKHARPSFTILGLARQRLSLLCAKYCVLYRQMFWFNFWKKKRTPPRLYMCVCVLARRICWEIVTI